WRARFSLDVEPLGPVHVQIALTGACTRVGVWAERPDAMARLQAGEAALSAALREAELSPEVAFHAGSPTVAATEPGHFVDQAS
ncbi:MAG TPA: flagellar hook-length control protein FliK, partial [Caulobacter sp.]|nr:flagellar hook-length control protein FliK [Caulobacter sp.]